MRHVIRVLLMVAAVYVGLCLVLVLARSRLVFPLRGGMAGEPARFGIGDGEAVRIPVSGGDTLGAWLLPAVPDSGPAPVLIWFHGNGETVAALAPVLRDFRPHGVALLAVDYRGYGASTGSVTLANAEEDVESVWVWLASRAGVDTSRVVVYGRSVGSGPAAALAARRPVAGLILESAFTSLGAMARVAYPIFPAFLAGSRLDNVKHVAASRCPILFIHGDRDGVIPARMSHELAAVAGPRGEPWIIAGADHNETYDVGGEEYVRRVQAFVARVVGGRRD